MTNKEDRDNLRDMQKEVSSELRELGRELRHRADDVRKEAAKQLNTAAATIRKEAHAADSGSEVRQSADELAKGLERAATYLNSRSVDEMGQDATRVVQRYPLKALLITFIVGALIGLLMRRDYEE